MEYESKSKAHWALALSGLMAGIGVGVTAVGLAEGQPEALVALLLLPLAAFVSTFRVLTVQVSADEVRWFFGSGWLGRSVPLARVRGAEARRSAWYWGWGIRWTPSGWLWRAHGLDAVWLELENGRSVGIGTEDPEGLERAVRERLA